MAADGPRRSIRRGLGARLWSTSKVAVSAARLAARRTVGLEGDGDRRLGETLARELDQMKGMAMKVGQILSYFEGILPESTHAALRGLQQGAQPLAFETVAEVIESALGRPVPQLFDALTESPVAAASIGQVHRGRVGAQDVAVKVQYPGIRDTIDADFSRIGRLAKIASLASAVDGDAMVAELRERFVEECDYRIEAENLRQFARVFDGDPDVEIPPALPSHSGQTVITTRWAEGIDFYAFVESASEARRAEVARVIVRFAYRCLFQLLAINADPHPGNYRFRFEGPTAFLDFGCVRRFDPAFVDAERRVARVLLDGDRAAFDDAVLATGMVAKPHRFDFDHHWAMMRHQLAPYLHPRYRLTSEYIRAGMQLSGPTSPNVRLLRIPPPWMWYQRLQWGLHAVLVRLDVEVDYGTLLREALEGPVTPLPDAA